MVLEVIFGLRQRRIEVYGIDISKTAIKKCNNRLDEEISCWAGEMTVGDCLLCYEDNFFDQ